MTKFADRLKEALVIRGISQAELCKRTGISKGAISQYVNGIIEARSDKLFALAKALNVNESWLLGYDVPMNRPGMATKIAPEIGTEPHMIVEINYKNLEKMPDEQLQAIREYLDLVIRKRELEKQIEKDSQ